MIESPRVLPREATALETDFPSAALEAVRPAASDRLMGIVLEFEGRNE